jgi:hypothetical protein
VRDAAIWLKTADFLAVMIALALPWSTSLVGILTAMWVAAVIPTLDLRPSLESRPTGALPVGLGGRQDVARRSDDLW